MLDEGVDSRSEPFGDADVDTEIKRLKNRYQDIYLRETLFSTQALDDRVYLISGRRGTGKTALSRYFKFQEQIPDVLSIEVRQRDAYPREIASIAKNLSTLRATVVEEMVKVWEVVIWSVILEHLQEVVKAAPPVSARDSKDRTPSGLLMGILGTINRGLKDQPSRERRIESLINPVDLANGIHQVKSYVSATNKRVIVSLDTMEKYDAHDASLMMGMASLIQLASIFNLEHAPGVEIKLFLPGELFSHLEESVVPAPSKHIRSPLHLIWTPSELLRLIMWRFWRHLFMTHSSVRMKPPKVAWSDPYDVYRKMWREHFDKNVTLESGEESSLVYILRHTQMRPRQIIKLCNAVAASTVPSGFPPKYNQAAIRTGVLAEQGRLVADLINSFAESYPNVGSIINTLAGLPPVVDEPTLLKHAALSRPYWRPGLYSPDAYRDLLAEVGVIGRVHKRRQDVSVIEAEFSYSSPDRIVIGRNEVCVIHPMFYRRLGIKLVGVPRVLPFAPQQAELDRIIK